MRVSEAKCAEEERELLRENRNFKSQSSIWPTLFNEQIQHEPSRANESQAFRAAVTNKFFVLSPFHSIIVATSLLVSKDIYFFYIVTRSWKENLAAAYAPKICIE